MFIYLNIQMGMKQPAKGCLGYDKIVGISIRHSEVVKAAYSKIPALYFPTSMGMLWRDLAAQSR